MTLFQQILLLYVCLGTVVLLINFYWHFRFRQMLRRPTRSGGGAPSRLRALVVLPLRGADPDLEETLLRLTKQSFQNFTLRIIIDSEQDPAWTPVNAFLKLEHRPVTEIQILTRRMETCSLKANALIQGMSKLEPEYDVVVQLDADALPYANWLEDMLSPFQNPQVGAVSGLRWYVPVPGNWATRVRQIWGSGAMVQMYVCQMAWGGSLALRRQFLEQGHLFSTWSKCLAEDLALNTPLKAAGLELAFVPAVLTNREQTNFASCFEFIRRQIFLARWQHAQWPLIASVTWLMIISTLLGFSGLFLALFRGAWWSVVLMLFLLKSNAYLYGKALTMTESHIRIRLRAQGENVPPVGMSYQTAISSTAFIFAACFISANFIHRIIWRGVEYEAFRKNEFRVIKDGARHIPNPEQIELLPRRQQLI